jgi:hypothetical protein
MWHLSFKRRIKMRIIELMEVKAMISIRVKAKAQF